VELAGGLRFLDADLCDVGAGGASVAPLYEAGDHLLAALDHSLDVSVGQVPDPALEVMVVRHALDTCPVADTVHPAPDEEVCADHWRSSTP